MPVRAAAAESNAAPVTASKAEDASAQEVLRAYLQLQEQLHATQLAIEQNRRESKEAAVRNEETMASRLHGIEQALTAQRARELEAMQSSNRVMLIVAGSFAVVGFVAMLLMAYFQWRTVHGLVEISTILPSRALGPGALAALGPGDVPLPGGALTGSSNVKLLSALGQLEQRLYQLEHTAHLEPEVEVVAKSGNGNSNGRGQEPEPEDKGTSDKSDFRALLAKGESLLDRNEPEAALNCFDQAAALEPNHAEALVKKGAALERLQKLEEAIACYDKAIAMDGSMTIAYLHKGGVYNRLERFTDALACYEQALRTQEKNRG